MIYPHKQIGTIEQLDSFINYLTENKISFLSNDLFPSMTPEIKFIYSRYVKALQVGNVEHALSVYNSILSSAPDFVAARYNMAHFMKQSGNLDEALNHYMLAARYNPSDPSIIIEIGVTYSMLGMNEEAIEAFLNVLKITSESNLSGSNLTIRWLAMFNIGLAYRETQEYMKSLQWLEKALEWVDKHNIMPSMRAWDSEYVTTYLELGNLYKDFGDKQKAEEMYLKGMQTAAKNKSSNQDLRQHETYIWLNLGEIYLDMKKWSEAEHYLEKCLQRHPNNKYFQLLLRNAQNKNFGQ
jgi:tetratricopeptide (TPR) repeat protein